MTEKKFDERIIFAATIIEIMRDVEEKADVENMARYHDQIRKEMEKCKLLKK